MEFLNGKIGGKVSYISSPIACERVDLTLVLAPSRLEGYGWVGSKWGRLTLHIRNLEPLTKGKQLHIFFIVVW